MPEPEAADADESRQLALTRRLVELSVERTRQSEIRTELSRERSRESEKRTAQAKVRTRESKLRTELSRGRSAESEARTRESKLRTELSRGRSRESEARTRESKIRTRESEERTRQSKLRSELSAGRSYMNAERTLSVWVRTALAVMVVGIAIDRFGLSLSERPGTGARPGSAADWMGAGMIAFGVLIAVVTAVRFARYARAFRRDHAVPWHHGPYMAPAFAMFTALFGVALLVLTFAAL